MSDKIIVCLFISTMFAMASILKWFIEENKKEEKEVEELNRQEKENGTWGRYER